MFHINLWNTATNQKLITFAGCNTAGGNKDGSSSSSDSNITKRAVDRGADAAVGWTTTVSAGSHTNWLKRYNDALAEGETLSQAISHANSYIYLPGSGVKNVKYYGSGSLTITSTNATLDAHVYDMSILENRSNQMIIEEIFCSAILSSDVVTVSDEYVCYAYEANNGCYWVDVYFKSNGVITSAAISIQLNGDGDIVGVNTQDLPTNNLSNISTILNQRMPTLASINKKKQIALEEQSSVSLFESVHSQTQFEYYDVARNKTFLITYTEVVDELGAKYIKEDVSLVG